MNLEERKKVEDKIDSLLEGLTKGEQAIVYKTLYALGFKIADCDEIIRKEPAPQRFSEAQSQRSHSTPQVYLSCGWPTNPRGV
jgi:hypothetical protein